MICQAEGQPIKIKNQLQAQPMKLLYFRNGNLLKLGIQTEQGIFDVDRYQQDKGGKL